MILRSSWRKKIPCPCLHMELVLPSLNMTPQFQSAASTVALSQLWNEWSMSQKQKLVFIETTSRRCFGTIVTRSRPHLLCTAFSFSNYLCFFLIKIFLLKPLCLYNKKPNGVLLVPISTSKMSTREEVCTRWFQKFCTV